MRQSVTFHSPENSLIVAIKMRFKMEIEMLSTLETDWVNFAVELNPPTLKDIGVLPPEDLFFGKPRTELNFGGKDGLRQGPAFSPEELGKIRSLVHDHLVGLAEQVSPDMGNKMASTSLENYHQVANAYPHAQMLAKSGRIMSAKDVATIRSMSFFDYMAKALGEDFYLSDEDGTGHEQICLRIVRPNVRDDVGSLHRDSWFWDVYEWPVPAGWARVKTWVPIVVSPLQSGLLLAKGSHLIDAPYHTDHLGDKFVFVPEFDPTKIGIERYSGNAGEPIMFGYDNLHCGTINRADFCRVSIEITFMFRTQA